MRKLLPVLVLALTSASDAQFRAVSAARASAGSSAAASVTGARAALTISPAAAGSVVPASSLAPAAASTAHYEDMLAVIEEAEKNPAPAKAAPVQPELKGRAVPVNHADDMKAVVDQAIAEEDALAARQALDAKFDLSKPAPSSAGEIAGQPSAGMAALEPAAAASRQARTPAPPRPILRTAEIGVSAPMQLAALLGGIAAMSGLPLWGAGAVAVMVTVLTVIAANPSLYEYEHMVRLERYLGVFALGLLAGAVALPASAEPLFLVGMALFGALLAGDRARTLVLMSGLRSFKTGIRAREVLAAVLAGIVAGIWIETALLAGGLAAGLAMLSALSGRGLGAHGDSLLVSMAGSGLLLAALWASPGSIAAAMSAVVALLSGWALRQWAWRRWNPADF